MSIHHIVEAGYINIEPMNDPLAQSEWLQADSPDLLTYITPIAGPATSLMIHRFATYIAAGETWINFELADLGQTFGIGYNNGTNDPVIRSLERIDRFGFGRLDPAKPLLKLRTALPPISRRLAERLPAYLAATCPYIVR